MVHNGIEYGLMAAYAEGFNLMKHGKETGIDIDVAKVAEVWRHGSVVRSWLLDLIASALSKDPQLATFKGVRVGLRRGAVGGAGGGGFFGARAGVIRCAVFEILLEGRG